MENEKMIALLEEIRDVQRQHFEEYRRVANEALAIQKQAVAQQKIAVDAQTNHIRLYRKVLVGAVIVVGAAIWLIAKHI